MITLAHSLVTYHVTGLDAESCLHCVESVQRELALIPGVVGVDVNHAMGRVSVLMDGPVEESFVLAAIEDAGCEVDLVPRWHG
ncbi:heavy-metal-associated domain-containing protein [Nonomuraea sp. NBC_01738]|uniref:heavy-metal-associated domain-containing protein n=1 Tax=Nonomuraea sp. NBC_01738 TaxID=2976003 RepID=UPI002E162D88|nr:heavy-metal-associated domain-containing protein [Nonomuraea sp. NBC_01738]